MMDRMRRLQKSKMGFTMIELMVVVIIVGVLAAIAIPIYADYIKKSRVSEATARMGDILTASKAYAQEFGTWPADETAAGFIGDVSASVGANGFNAFTVDGTGSTALVIESTGKGNMAGVTVTMNVGAPNTNGSITVTGL